MVHFKRLLRHLFTPHLAAQRAFTPAVQRAIEQAVRTAEAQHHGEIRFVVETALDPADAWRGTTPRERALELFAQLRVWDTEHRHGVLLYVLWADHAVELVADRGIDRQVSGEPWPAICRELEAAYRTGRFEAGSVAAVQAIAALLQRAEREAGWRNELPDAPLVR